MFLFVFVQSRFFIFLSYKGKRSKQVLVQMPQDSLTNVLVFLSIFTCCMHLGWLSIQLDFRSGHDPRIMGSSQTLGSALSLQLS